MKDALNYNPVPAPKIATTQVRVSIKIQVIIYIIKYIKCLKIFYIELQILREKGLWKVLKMCMNLLAFLGDKNHSKNLIIKCIYIYKTYF